MVFEIRILRCGPVEADRIFRPLIGGRDTINGAVAGAAPRDGKALDNNKGIKIVPLMNANVIKKCDTPKN